MDKELIDQLWNRATRETLNSGELNERYRFAELVAEHEREAINKICLKLPVTEYLSPGVLAVLAALRARGEA